jgi:RNA polymerase sigma-70 factor (ECF subfamily)
MSSPSQYNERTLLIKVAGGDQYAFRELYLYWHQVLAGYIYRITESKNLTEEIVQDAFLKIWMARETLSEIDNFKHFLLVVSRNQAFDVLKKQLKEEENRKAWEKSNSAQPNNGQVESELFSYSVIDAAIDQLPPRRKEVWLLSRHERLTYKEIAGRLGISPESVKTHLKLASEAITRFIRAHLPSLIVVYGMVVKKIF